MNRARRTSEPIQEPPNRKRVRRFALTPVRAMVLAAIPVAILALYVTVIAPQSIPVPPDVKVPFPAATRFLERVCMWAAAHPGRVVMIALGLVLIGLIPIAGRRYLIALTAVASLALAFTYLSISAPIDRLLNTVEANISDTTRTVPDFLPGGTSRE